MRWPSRNITAPMPVPLDVYREQIKRQSIRNIQLTRDQLLAAMGHLILPPDADLRTSARP